MPSHCATVESGSAGVATFGSRVSRLLADVGGFEGDGLVTMSPTECLDLLDLFAAVSDGRSDQARAHPVAAVLTLAAAAVVAGMRSLTAIAGWVLDVPVHTREQLYLRCGMAAGVPSKSTLWRVVTGADATVVDQAIGVWLAQRYLGVAGGCPDAQPASPDHADRSGVGLVALMVDGKTVRGAKDEHGNQVHLLAAATQDKALVLAQTDVSAKTNEIPMFQPLLDTLDIAGMVITADPLHTQREHAKYLHRRGADFIFWVKDNQPKLFSALDVLDWSSIPISHTMTDRGHGRIELRTIQIRPTPPGLPFPYVEQVFLIERGVTDVRGKSLSNVAIFGITSLNPDRAGPAQLAQLTRGHWGIESLHWIRDAVYREDDSTMHTGSGPRVMASLRNLSIGALRLSGRNDIAEAARWATRNMDRPFNILGLTT